MNLFRVSSEHSKAAMAVVQDACDRLSALGISQWPTTFPAMHFEACVARNEIYGIESSGEVAAVFRLTWHDPETWGGQDGADGSAGYIHTLSVHRKFSQRGIGYLALRLAQDEIKRFGRAYVRLDCVAHNPFLIRYYEAYGFRFIREQLVEDTKLRLYEKRLITP